MISESGLAEDRVLVKKWIEMLKIKHLSMISENKNAWRGISRHAPEHLSGYLTSIIFLVSVNRPACSL